MKFQDLKNGERFKIQDEFGIAYFKKEEKEETNAKCVDSYQSKFEPGQDYSVPAFQFIIKLS